MIMGFESLKRLIQDGTWMAEFEGLSIVFCFTGYELMSLSDVNKSGGVGGFALYCALYQVGDFDPTPPEHEHKRNKMQKQIPVQ